MFKARLSQPRIGKNFDLSFVVRFSVYVVWPSDLSLNNLKVLKIHKTKAAKNTEPAIWSCDTGRQRPCFDRCQLTLTWMSNIKEGRSKPNVHIFQPISH